MPAHPLSPWIECHYVRPGVGLLGLKNGQIPIAVGTPLSVGRATTSDIRLLCDDAVLEERSQLLLFESQHGGWFRRQGTLLRVSAQQTAIRLVRGTPSPVCQQAGLSLDGVEVASQRLWLESGDCIEVWPDKDTCLLRLGFYGGSR